MPGGKGIRTPDIQLAKLALYQLSYAPVEEVGMWMADPLLQARSGKPRKREALRRARFNRRFLALAPRNSEAIEDLARRIGLVERVEVNSAHAVV